MATRKRTSTRTTTPKPGKYVQSTIELPHQLTPFVATVEGR